MHGVIDRAHALTVRMHGPYYTNSGYYHMCMRTARSATQWLITVRLTSRPNVSDQLTLIARAQYIRHKIKTSWLLT